MFQFVPNEKQVSGKTILLNVHANLCISKLFPFSLKVKAASKLLKTISQGNGNRQIDGVPVFSAQNLDIAIATSDGIKW